MAPVEFMASGASEVPTASVAKAASGVSNVLDPAAVAESYGYGFWRMEDPADFVAGVGASTGDIYQWLDKTIAQHGGTITHRSGTDNINLPVAVPGTGPGTGYWRCSNGTSERLWTNKPPINGQMAMLMVFRFPNGVGNPERYLFGHETGVADRPFVKFNSSGVFGNWELRGSGGGSGDIITQGEGVNIQTTVNVTDGNWHCLLIHWSDQANEGTIMDLDGQQLIGDNTLFSSVADFDVGGFVYDGFWNLAPTFNAGSGAFTSPEDCDYAALACGNHNVNTHAQSREVAAALMARYGITNLG